jgi:hypothetical protein
METEILVVSSLISLVSLAVAIKCFYSQSKNRNLLEFAYRQIDELEKAIEKRGDEILQTESKTLADYSRRIAWLESRTRNPKASKNDEADVRLSEKTKDVPPANITERRHRIMSLANSGQNAETISEMLGMLPGEVQLVINLSRASHLELA